MDENVTAKVAGRQRGVVSARQMHAAEFDKAATKRRCRAQPSIGCTGGL
jgi:hypothetical protein